MPEYQEGSDPQNGLPAEQAGPSQEQLNPEQNQPSPEELQARLKEFEERAAKAEQERDQERANARQHQAAYTQSRQQLAALTGVEQQQRQVNPVDELAQRIIASGKITNNPEQARAFAEIMHGTVAPLQQQNAYLHAAMQNSHQVDAVLKSAFQEDPQLFQDPEVSAEIENYVRQEAMQAAQQGQPLNPEVYKRAALAVGAQAQYFRNRQNLNQNQPPQRQISTPNFSSMSGVGNGMNMRGASQAAPQKQYTPEQLALQAQLDEDMKRMKGAR